MKPGDLVRLKAGYPSATGVAVSWGRPGILHLLDVTRFEAGTPALLLQTDEVEFRKDHHSVAFILIDGRVGWVWPQELEPL